jgi:hypothetical protein
MVRYFDYRDIFSQSMFSNYKHISNSLNFDCALWVLVSLESGLNFMIIGGL